MKKIFTLLVIGLLVCDGAMITPALAYGGFSRPAFGSNAAFTPANRIRAGRINRRIQYEKAVIHSMKNRNNYNFNINTPSSGRISQSTTSINPATEMSRFNRNYSINNTPKTYTRGGVTYYN